MTVDIFSKVLDHPKLPPSVQNTMVALLKALGQKNSVLMMQIIGNLPTLQQQTLMKYI